MAREGVKNPNSACGRSEDVNRQGHLRQRQFVTVHLSHRYIFGDAGLVVPQWPCTDALCRSTSASMAVH